MRPGEIRVTQTSSHQPQRAVEKRGAPSILYREGSVHTVLVLIPVQHTDAEPVRKEKQLPRCTR
jgi:hypothetical protein